MAEAAGRIANEEKCLRKFKSAGAISPETAVKLEEIDLERDFVLKDLIKWGLLKETKDGRYYAPSEETTSKPENKSKRREPYLKRLLRQARNWTWKNRPSDI